MSDSLTKQAFMKGLTGALSRAAQDMKATRSDRHGLLDQTKSSWSFVGSAMGSAQEHGVVGAGLLNKGLHAGRKVVSDADSFLGSLAAGKDWNTSGNKSLRKSLFTDSKDNYLKIDDKGLHRRVTLPSISAPLKETAAIVTPMWAMSEGYKQMDAIRGKKDTDGVANQYY